MKGNNTNKKMPTPKHGLQNFRILGEKKKKKKARKWRRGDKEYETTSFHF